MPSNSFSWTKTTTVSSSIASNVLSDDKAQYLLVFSSLIAQIVYLLLNKSQRVKTVVLALFCS